MKLTFIKYTVAGCCTIMYTTYGWGVEGGRVVLYNININKFLLNNQSSAKESPDQIVELKDLSGVSVSSVVSYIDPCLPCVAVALSLQSTRVSAPGFDSVIKCCR